MTTNTQTGNNHIFDIHVINLTEMDMIIPGAELVSARQWVEIHMSDASNNMNDAINAFQSTVEEMVYLHHPNGGDPNNPSELSEFYFRFVINVGDSTGKEHPGSYVQHPMGFGNNVIYSIAGVDTSNPVGALTRAKRIRDGVKAHDNRHHHTAMVTIAQQQLNNIAENIEYKDADNVVDSTDDEVDDAVDVNCHSIASASHT
jgi:hypothetical protein